MTEKEKDWTTIRVLKETHKLINAYAKAQGRKQIWVIKQAIEKFCKGAK